MSDPSFLRAAALCAASACSSVVSLAGQQPAAGYLQSVDTFLPSTTASVNVPGGVVSYDGFALLFDQGTGGTPTQLIVLPQVFPSFIRLVGTTHVLMGESSQGNLYLVPLSGPSTPTPLANVPFSFACDFFDANSVIVSAKAGGLGAQDNDLIELDLRTGAVTTLGAVPGASGPVAVTPGGGLLYSTGSLLFPPPMGAQELIFWNPAQVAAARAGGVALSYGSARVVVSGLEGFSDMVLDGDGDLFFSDYTLARVGEIDDVLGANPVVKTLVDYSAVAGRPAALQFFDGASAAADFEPFQKAQGGQLLVSETDYISFYAVRALQPEPATLGVAGLGPNPTVTPGPFTIELAGGAPGGTAFLVLSLLPAVLPDARLAVPGFEQVIDWNPAMTIPLSSVFVSLDALGQGQWQAVNPGLGRFGISIQAAFADAAVLTIGSTPADDLTLL